jgi:polysaccharide biosynthesis transport protein
MNDIALQERLQPEAALGRGRPEEAFDLLEYWRAIAKRRWSILGLTVLVGILALLIVNNMRPLYRATATLLIEQGKSKVVSIEEVYSQGFAQREYYQTQAEILKSEELARNHRGAGDSCRDQPLPAIVADPAREEQPAGANQLHLP